MFKFSDLPLQIKWNAFLENIKSLSSFLTYFFRKKIKRWHHNIVIRSLVTFTYWMSETFSCLLFLSVIVKRVILKSVSVLGTSTNERFINGLVFLIRGKNRVNLLVTICHYFLFTPSFISPPQKKKNLSTKRQTTIHIMVLI